MSGTVVCGGTGGEGRLPGQVSRSGVGCWPWLPALLWLSRSLIAGGFTLDSAIWAQLTAWGDYDPRDDLACLTTPTLAIFGEDDPLVPVRASVERYQETAARTARSQQTLVFPEPATGCRSPQALPRDT